MPTTTERGYGAEHERKRAKYQKRMDAGEVFGCWRCGKSIPNVASLWDLGHDDNDRTKYMGPEHRSCNRAVQRRKAANVVDTSREW